MTFNSVAFGIFFLSVIGLCRLLPQWRVAILLAGSFVFYSWLSWAFGIVLFAMSVVGYFGPQQFRIQTYRARKRILVFTIAAILSPLFILKYWNFVVGTFEQALTAIGVSLTLTLIHIRAPLPPGISFHTFQLLAYVIDVFKKRAPIENRPGIFFLFSSFFPQLVAGPIERPNHLIPQLDRAGLVAREDVAPAFRLFLYGLFLKSVIADVVGIKVDQIYNAPPDTYGGAALLAATMLFYVQIYCDFAGYSLMAIGVARAIGVRLVRNFNQPMIAASPTDFWHRWHISLSQWFRDYVYIPLGGNREGVLHWMWAVMATFVLSGLWHGANWTFVIWGGLHGIALIISVLLSRVIPQPVKNLPAMIVIAWLATQLFVTVSWVFFRARTGEQAFRIVAAVGHDFFLSTRGWLDLSALHGLLDIPSFTLFVAAALASWVFVLDRMLGQDSDGQFNWSPLVGVLNEIGMIVIIAFAITLNPTRGATFIYFQF